MRANRWEERVRLRLLTCFQHSLDLFGAHAAVKHVEFQLRVELILADLSPMHADDADRRAEETAYNGDQTD